MTFINGKFAGHGGAIYNSYATTTMTITNCTFINNQVLNTTVQYYNNFGGAIYDNGVNTSITNCNFTNNAAYGRGGAIFFNGNYATLKNCNFNDNNAYADSIGNSTDDGNGGAVHTAIKNLLTIIGCNFTNNNAAQLGGAVYGSGSSRNLTVRDCNFIDNIAIGDGGGLYSVGGNNNNTVIYNITNCNFTGNKALNTNGEGYQYGAGGMFIGTRGNASIDGCNFINNSAGANGGGLGLYANNSNVVNCNFANNSANKGDAISNENNMSLSNNTIYDNSSGSSHIYNEGNILSDLKFTFISNSTWIVKKGSTITLFAVMTDDMGNAIDGKINFYINGIFNATIMSVGGIAELNYTVSSAGLFSISENSSRSNFFSNTGLLRVVDNVNISINGPDTVKVGDKRVIESRFVDQNGDPIANQRINFYLNDEYIGSAVTDSNGIAKINYTFNKVSNFKLLATFVPNNTTTYGFNDPINASKIVTVTKIVTNSKINADGNVKVGNKVTIRATITDDNGSPVVGVIVNFYINGAKIGSVNTNSNGIATLNYKFTKAGTYTITAEFSENSQYKGSTANTKIKTTYKDNPHIEITVDGNKVTATVTDENGNPIKGKKIYFRANGSIIGSGITNANGKTSIYYKDAYKYKITASFEDDDKINTTSEKVNGKVAMKKTGVPVIAILLTLLLSFGLLRYRKQE